MNKDNEFLTTQFPGKGGSDIHQYDEEKELEQIISPTCGKPLVMGSTDKLTVFINRLRKLGVDIKLVGNYPWIYIDTINGKKVTERFEGNHGFTIAFLPIRVGQELHFTDIGEIFKLLRKYCP